MLAATDILLGLQIAIAVIVIVVLYHVLFIAVNARKIVRRVEDITSQVEEVILKPISVADHVFDMATSFIEKKQKESTQKKSSSKKK